MTIHERMQAFWAGERPDQIPLTIYGFFCGDWVKEKNPDWLKLFQAGLAPFHLVGMTSEPVQGVEWANDSFEKDGATWHRAVQRTPVGEIQTIDKAGWRQEYWLKTAQDYRVMTWLVEHRSVEPMYQYWDELQRDMAPYAVLAPSIFRTPIQEILVDLVGLENFAVHLYDFEAEMMELYQAMLKKFRRRVEIVAAGPGRYVSCLENFTAETMGPVRYKQFILPVYEELFPILHQAGKIVGVHYDGKLASCRDAIAGAPVDLIESLTGPPEGDMTYDQCRAAWPEKLFWANLNVSDYQLPPAKLKARVHELVAQASPDGTKLAFEVSEDLPANWRESIPVVMEALNETRAK
ncbi:MAG: hypothetical protein NT031_08460 [Planctomycetota bacterium]|nr:hypothetical protein [Planctomycetota bacterium]